ncbi:hypothetical protein EAO71_06500 [Streptomyces sp. ms191]|uniref:hypothetical protein n=1 Tax=Streptomyces sp. ms191 TaxID=1827978 RepID=UPI0011CE12A4|nr:hypothetical protein [Streptomyces sp. ms191]TXS31492.1 hypothetical protein EAO71_06500 [Streptomyces sp. ms191]
MSDLVRRWVVAASSVAVFALVVAVVRAASWSWLPDGSTDRWALGAAGGTVVAAAFLFALTRPTPTPSGPESGDIEQIAEAGDGAVIEQTAGDRGSRCAGSRRTTTAGRLRQRATGSGTSRIRQTGGSDNA